jgi:drug/metabolite transporter (DMT)-like permease
LQRLSSSIYIIVCFIYPSLVVLYSFFSGSAVPRLFWLGMPLTLFGLLLTTFEFGSVFAIDPIGLLITIVNASALAAYMILSGKVFKTVQNKLPGTTIAMSAAMLVGIILIPFLGIEIPNTLEGWVMLVLLSTIGTVMPFFAMNYGLSLLTTARGSIIITIQPVLTVLLGMIFLNETLTLQQWIGGGLVILAIILLERSPDRALTRAVKSES